MMDNVQMIRGQAAQIQMEKKTLPAMSRLSPLWSLLARAAGCAHSSSAPELVGSNPNPAPSYSQKTAPNVTSVLQDPRPAPLVEPSSDARAQLASAGQRHGQLSTGFLPHPCPAPSGILGLRG